MQQLPAGIIILYIYIFIYTYIHIYIYIHTYAHIIQYIVSSLERYYFSSGFPCFFFALQWHPKKQKNGFVPRGWPWNPAGIQRLSEPSTHGKRLQTVGGSSPNLPSNYRPIQPDVVREINKFIWTSFNGEYSEYSSLLELQVSNLLCSLPWYGHIRILGDSAKSCSWELHHVSEKTVERIRETGRWNGKCSRLWPTATANIRPDCFKPRSCRAFWSIFTFWCCHPMVATLNQVPTWKSKSETSCSPNYLAI